ERPRAAAVCKLWNLAAKDTTLWTAVGSVLQVLCVVNLRKILLSSGRSEDIWSASFPTTPLHSYTSQPASQVPSLAS
ncbi:hypothetical protein DOY81_003671, partial [Sarcophaga bullata]